MAQLAKDFFMELEKYEKEGVESMDWAEWAHEDITKYFVDKFSISDWQYINATYKDKSDNIKSLLTWHISLFNLKFTDIKLKILTDMVMTENEDVAFEALRQIHFYFITSGRDLKTNEEFVRKELKGVFLINQKQNLIDKFFDKAFNDKSFEIANGCGELFKNNFTEFLKVIKEA